MRDLIRTAAFVGAAICTLALAVERAYAAPIMDEVEAKPCLCDPMTKAEARVEAKLSQTNFDDDAVPTTLSVMDSFPGASTVTYSLAALDGRMQEQARLFSVSAPRVHDWLSEGLSDHLQLGLMPSALPLLGIGFAALGLFARRRNRDWRMLDSE